MRRGRLDTRSHFSLSGAPLRSGGASRFTQTLAPDTDPRRGTRLSHLHIPSPTIPKGREQNNFHLHCAIYPEASQSTLPTML